MHDIAVPFVARCPHCSTQLRVKGVYRGRKVRCKQCGRNFLAEETEGPRATQPNGERRVETDSSPGGRVRIDLNCPACVTSLRVPASYFGHRIACKRCAHVFVAAPASPPPSRTVSENATAVALEDPRLLPSDPSSLPWEIIQAREADYRYKLLLTENNNLKARKQQLKARKQQLKSIVADLEVKNERLASECRSIKTDLHTCDSSRAQLNEQLDAVTAELARVRGELGDLSPAEVRALREREASLRSEVERLAGEVRLLQADRSSRDRTSERLGQTEAILAAALAEVDRSTRLLELRDGAIKAALADLQDAVAGRQTALDDAERMRSEFAGREARMLDEVGRLGVDCSRLRSECESLHGDLESTVRAHRAELADLVGEIERARERSRVADDLSSECDRLRSELGGLRSESEAFREALGAAERAHRDELARFEERLDDAERVHREEVSRLEEELARTRDRDVNFEALFLEGDRLRSDVGCLRSEGEELRRTLDHLERAHADERTRWQAQLDLLTGRRNRLLHDESISRLLAEREDPNRELVEGLAVLQLAQCPLAGSPPTHVGFEVRSYELPRWSPDHEAVALAETPPMSTAATQPAADDELLAARAEIDALNRQLARAETRLNEMASMLDVMGVRYSTGATKSR